MNLSSLIFFGTKLYTKYAAASPLTQRDINLCFREFYRTGAIPLGYRKDEGGMTVAWWLLYDESKFKSETALLDALREMTPSGVAIKIIHL